MNEYSETKQHYKQFQHVNALIEESKRYHFRGRWVTVFTHQFAESVRKLTAQQRRVLDILMTIVGYRNYVRVTHEELAQMLALSQNAISKCISKLCKQGVIYKHHDYVYEIDPRIMWFGKRQELFETNVSEDTKYYSAVEIMDKGKYVTTLHFPKVSTYQKYKRRYWKD